MLSNTFAERPSRSLKDECIYLHDWKAGSEVKAGVGKRIEFYGRKRPHSSLGGIPLAKVY